MGQGRSKALLDEKELVEMYDEDFADEYDETVLFEYGYTAHTVIPTYIVEQLKTVPGVHKVLDLGCGTGLSSTEFFKHNARVASGVASGDDSGDDGGDDSGGDTRVAGGAVADVVVKVAIKVAVEVAVEVVEGADGGCATFEVTGMDLSPAMLAHAHPLPYHQLLCGNVEVSLPFAERIFDAVVMVGVMEFISDVYTVLTRIHLSLKIGGLLGITIPQKLKRHEERELCIRTYEPSTVPIELARAGFEVVGSKELLGYRWDKTDVKYTCYFCRALPPSIADSSGDRHTATSEAFKLSARSLCERAKRAMNCCGAT
jgi:predicted TPR repeat methyltransferase